jgi:hypothetical protein
LRGVFLITKKISKGILPALQTIYPNLQSEAGRQFSHLVGSNFNIAVIPIVSTVTHRASPILAAFGALAKFERNLIQERTQAGQGRRPGAGPTRGSVQGVEHG